MMRLSLILALVTAPALAETRPIMRPEGLVQRATVVPEAEIVAESAIPQAAAPSGMHRAEIGARLAAAIRNCWNVGALSDAALGMNIWVAFENSPEGYPIHDTIRMTEYSGGSAAAGREAFEAARRAIARCGGAGFDLPPEHFAIWQRVEVQFDAATLVAQ